jgi:L-cysteine:1D-myo-inositol 2-amino-2-deoxy-alpha-D-glucopyranoside ligase
LLLFNTLTRRKEPFLPRDGRVGMYVCGITPYDVTHLGHAFCYVFYDTLSRYLQYQGVGVTYVQNITDVDDDIIRRAKELGEPVSRVVSENVAEFNQDLRALHVSPPTHYPRATEYIASIIAMAETLLRGGHAYVKGGNVFFRSSSYPEFGELSGRAGTDLVSQTEPDRLHEQMDDRRDFTLWQESLAGEPSWPSPWGQGRPGWHSECAVMSSELLGIPVDIHGGGGDLIFPHHESERAEVECAGGGRPFVRHWVHTGMLRIGGEKMSKSLKNLVLVDDLLKAHEAAAIRAYLLSHHYRAEPEYRQDDLAAWGPRIALLRRAAAVSGGSGAALDYRPEERRLLAALDDDMNTPEALNALLALADAIVKHGENGLDTGLAVAALRAFSDGVFGLSIT